MVVGVDGSRTGPATVGLAAEEAVRRRAPLLIVHVWPGRYTGVFRGPVVVAASARSSGNATLGGPVTAEPH